MWSAAFDVRLICLCSWQLLALILCEFDCLCIGKIINSVSVQIMGRVSSIGSCGWKHIFGEQSHRSRIDFWGSKRNQWLNFGVDAWLAFISDILFDFLTFAFCYFALVRLLVRLTNLGNQITRSNRLLACISPMNEWINNVIFCLLGGVATFEQISLRGQPRSFTLQFSVLSSSCSSSQSQDTSALTVSLSLQLVSCSLGWQFDNTAQVCSECIAGQFRNSSMTFCEACLPSWYQSLKGTFILTFSWLSFLLPSCCRISAVDCQSNWLFVVVGQSMCLRCPGHLYSSINGASECTACPAGQVVNQQQTGCDDGCPGGSAFVGSCEFPASAFCHPLPMICQETLCVFIVIVSSLFAPPYNFSLPFCVILHP